MLIKATLTIWFNYYTTNTNIYFPLQTLQGRISDIVGPKSIFHHL